MKKIFFLRLQKSKIIQVLVKKLNVNENVLLSEYLNYRTQHRYKFSYKLTKELTVICLKMLKTNIIDQLQYFYFKKM